MRKVSIATVAMLIGIALYFTVSWGIDALGVLASPTYGLEDVWRSQYVFGIGSLLGLGPVALIKLAAFFGALKLAVAVICALHIIDRFYSFATGKHVSDMLEGGLILVVLITIASAGPAIWSHNPELLRDQVIQLALAGLATALGMVERNYRNAGDSVAATADTPRGARWFTPWR
jgi:hypothetical protein